MDILIILLFGTWRKCIILVKKIIQLGRLWLNIDYNFDVGVSEFNVAQKYWESWLDVH
jgi:hypothetical protein